MPTLDAYVWICVADLGVVWWEVVEPWEGEASVVNVGHCEWANGGYS